MRSATPILLLSNFESVTPLKTISQTESLNWLAAVKCRALPAEMNSTPLQLKKKIDRFACSPLQIETRAFDLPEVADYAWENLVVYRSTENRDGEASSRHNFKTRNSLYKKRVGEVFERFYPKNERPPDHILHVTCTGYSSPSPAQELVARNGWRDTAVTHAYHMGCYAALPSIRVAEGLLATNRHSLIDIVHTEICSLHMNLWDRSPEQIVVQSLFADGHIKYSCGPAHHQKRGLKVLTVLEEIIPDTEHHLTWAPDSWGFAMTLSPVVPKILARQAKRILERLVAPLGISIEALLRNAQFAIHPGGPKIVESIQCALELGDRQVAASKALLRRRGNMSSASLPHIWKDLLSSTRPGELVVSLAFGPGLTIFASIFEST